MSSPDLDDALGSATDKVMAVDTSFLDAYRSGGAEGLQEFRTSQETLEPETEVDPKSEQPEIEPETAPEDMEAPTTPVQRGGESSAVAETAPITSDAEKTELIEPEGEAESVQYQEPDPPPGRHDETQEAEAARVRSLEHDDQQEAVQAASFRQDGSDTSAEALPSTGFKVTDASSQPTVRALPETMLNALREQLRSTAVRELEVDDSQAREFSQRLSQVSLVTAFLLAHLDLDVGVDASTARAAELFRSNDPLLGRVAERLDGLVEHERARGRELAQVNQELSDVRSTTAVLEQMLSYSVADRAENLGRGTAGVGDLDLSHRSALRLRDMARETTRKQHKIERDRDGRPIR